MSLCSNVFSVLECHFATEFEKNTLDTCIFKFAFSSIGQSRHLFQHVFLTFRRIRALELDLELGLWVFGVWVLGVWDLGAWALGVWVLTVWRVGHSRHFFLHVFLTFRRLRAWGLDIGTWSFGLWHFSFRRLCFGCLSFGRFSIE